MADGNTNGTATETKTESKMSRLLKQRQGRKPVEGKERKALLDKFKASHKAKEDSKLAHEQVLKKHAAVCEELILAFGDAKFQLADGRIFVPSSKGESAMYRELNKIDPETLIT